MALLDTDLRARKVAACFVCSTREERPARKVWIRVDRHRAEDFQLVWAQALVVFEAHHTIVRRLNLSDRRPIIRMPLIRQLLLVLVVVVPNPKTGAPCGPRGAERGDSVDIGPDEVHNGAIGEERTYYCHSWSRKVGFRGREDDGNGISREKAWSALALPGSSQLIYNTASMCRVQIQKQMVTYIMKRHMSGSTSHGASA